MSENTTHLSTWSLMQDERFEEAVINADRVYLENESLGELRNKVFALLQLDRLSEAIEVCRFIVVRSNGEIDSDYINLGATLWINNERQKAMDTWALGTNTKYADAAGGIEVPLMRFFGAVRMSSDELVSKEVEVLRKAVSRSTSIPWPGPVARFVVGELTLEGAVRLASSVPILRTKQLCLVHFFGGVCALNDGDESRFGEMMRECVALGSACYARPEFHLARNELQKFQRFGCQACARPSLQGCQD